jgi:hypothetical protein
MSIIGAMAKPRVSRLQIIGIQMAQNARPDKRMAH